MGHAFQCKSGLESTYVIFLKDLTSLIHVYKSASCRGKAKIYDLSGQAFPARDAQAER